MLQDSRVDLVSVQLSHRQIDGAHYKSTFTVVDVGVCSEITSNMLCSLGISHQFVNSKAARLKLFGEETY